MKTVDEIIANIPIDQSNLLHIIATRKIHGALLVSIKKAMKEYKEHDQKMDSNKATT